MGGVGGDMSALMALLVESGVKGVLMLAVVAAAALALRRSSAASRHLVWLAGAAGLLLLPLLGVVAPRWSVPGTALPWAAAGGVGTGDPVAGFAATHEAPLAASSSSVDRDAVSSASARSEPGVRSGTSSRSTGSEPGMRSADPSAPFGSELRIGSSGRAAAAAPAGGFRDGGPVAGAAPAFPRLLSEVRASDHPPVASPALPSPAAALLGVWVLGALLLLASLGASLLAVRRLQRRCRPFPAGRATAAADRVREAMGVRARVRLLQGEPGSMPMSWGLLSPVILLPEGAERWHAARLDAVLLHEMAHARRRDCLTQVLAEVARALHWPNPLAWTALERLRVEREHACDDLVLSQGARPSEYARELLSLARGFDVEPGISLAAVAMARPAHLRSRVTAVLEEGRHRSLTRRRVAATLAGAAALTLAVAGLAPAATPDAGRLAPDDGPPAAPVAEVAPASRPAPLPGVVGTGADAALPGGALSDDPLPEASFALPFASLSQAPSCGVVEDGWRNISSQSNNGRRRLTWKRPGCEVDIRFEGDIAFTSDFRGIDRLGRGALVQMEEDDGGSRRSLEIRPASDGEPAYRYRVDGRERTFDAAARAWHESLLLQAFRRGGYMAEERVAAMLRSGGVPAVLAELGALETDHVFAAYTAELLEQAALSEAQVVDLVTRARNRIDSDHYMGVILGAVADRHLGSDRVVQAFIEASGTIDSDHYRSEVLTRALERRDLPAASVEAVLASASSIESDHYLSELLREIGERYALEPRLRSAYMRSVDSIESDHYRAQVLATLMSRRDLDEDELAEVLRASRGIGSDHYLSEVLKDVASMALDSELLRGAYLEATRSIESDHYHAEALRHLVARDRLSREHLAGVLAAARGIGSGHYRAELLLEIVRRHPLEGALREAFLEAMDGIESSHYRGTVADALLRRERGGG